MVERLAEVGADLADLSVAERSLRAQLRQGRAVDQLADEQGVAVFFPDLVEGDDPRVIEAGGRLGLAQDPAAAVGGAASRSP